MKDRLTKLFTTFLAVVLLVGMSPAAASTAYAASWGGISSSVSSSWFSNFLGGLFGSSNKNEQNDANSKNNQSNNTTEQPTDPDDGGKLNLSK